MVAAIILMILLTACTQSPDGHRPKLKDSAVDSHQVEDTAVDSGHLDPVVADPGTWDNHNGNYCSESEPNDTPMEATPCGLLRNPSSGSTGMYAGVASIGGDDPIDWWVFQTGDQTERLHQLAWWSDWTAPVDLLDMVIYEVASDRTDYWEVKRFDTADLSGENLSYSTFEVAPSTLYLIEVISIEGVGDYAL